jgi:phosphoribosyl 1,2-cyclic phosphodiesterase
VDEGFCPLASGSKGNAIFVGTKTTRILIDAGLRFCTLIERLQEIDVDPKTLQAVIITHEHGDHIQGLRTLCDRLQIPVFSNLGTAQGICEVLGVRPRFKIFTTGEPFVFGDLEIRPFGISHDTRDPVAFTIHMGGSKLGFCTDLGYVTSLVQKELQGCDYLYLEANHQESMVHSSHRPDVYKKRVLSKQGHLSNRQCAELVAGIYHPGLKHIHLAHLSSECNTPELALQTVRQILHPSVACSVALQDCIAKPILL